PLLLGFCVGGAGDDEVQRVWPDVTPGLLGMRQQTPRVGRGRGKVVMANNELIVPVLRTEPHAPVRLAGTDNRHTARTRAWGEPTIPHGEELPAEVRAAGGPQLP